MPLPAVKDITVFREVGVILFRKTQELRMLATDPQKEKPNDL